MVCPDKEKLVKHYQYVTEQYSAAVTELQQKMGTLSRPDYEGLYRMTEALRQQTTEAQQKLQAHVRVHRC